MNLQRIRCRDSRNADGLLEIQSHWQLMAWRALCKNARNPGSQQNVTGFVFGLMLQVGNPHPHTVDSIACSSSTSWSTSTGSGSAAFQQSICLSTQILQVPQLYPIDHSGGNGKKMQKKRSSGDSGHAVRPKKVYRHKGTGKRDLGCKGKSTRCFSALPLQTES